MAMTISEADHVARIIRLLDGSTAGRNVDQAVESIRYLAGRIQKPLLLTIHVDEDVLHQNISRLIQTAAQTQAGRHTEAVTA